MGDTPRTVWWCEVHRSVATSGVKTTDGRQVCQYAWYSQVTVEMCHTVEFELHPLGTQEKLDGLMTFVDGVEKMAKAGAGVWKP